MKIEADTAEADTADTTALWASVFDSSVLPDSGKTVLPDSAKQRASVFDSSVLPDSGPIQHLYRSRYNFCLGVPMLAPVMFGTYYQTETCHDAVCERHFMAVAQDPLCLGDSRVDDHERREEANLLAG